MSTGTGTPVTPLSASLQTIIDSVRWRINNYEQPYLWSDAELVSYVNECMRQFLFETKMIEESTDTTICTLSLVDGTQDYAISDRIVMIRSARITDEDRNLVVKTFAEMDDEVPSWRGDTSEDVPTTIVTDWQHGYASFWPIPDDSYTCNLRVYRIQKTDFTSVSMSGQSLEIPVMYSTAIAEGTAAMALLKNGPNTYDAQQSQVHYAIFQSKIAEAKLMQLRLHSNPRYNKPHEGFI